MINREFRAGPAGVKPGLVSVDAHGVVTNVKPNSQRKTPPRVHSPAGSTNIQRLTAVTDSMLEMAEAHDAEQIAGNPGCVAITRDMLEHWRAIVMSQTDALRNLISYCDGQAAALAKNDENKRLDRLMIGQQVTNVDADMTALVIIAHRPPCEICLRADSAIAIMAMLQLALRHPGTVDTAAQQKAEGLKEFLLMHLAGGDQYAEELLRRGDDPTHDTPTPQQQEESDAT